MRHARLLSLLYLMLLWTSLHAQAGVVLVPVLAQQSLPPKWVNHNGRAEGVCPDILAAMERAEPRLRFTGQNDFRSVPMIESALETGRIGAACALLDTPLRQRVARRLEPPLYISRQRVAVAADDTASINSLDDLVQLNSLVTTSRGAGFADELRQRGLQVDDSTGDNLVNLKKILAGHGRFFYMNELTLNWLVREEGLHDKVRILPAVLHEQPIYFWISRKTAPDTARLIEGALAKVRANGELVRIFERWNSSGP